MKPQAAPLCVLILALLVLAGCGGGGGGAAGISGLALSGQASGSLASELLKTAPNGFAMSAQALSAGTYSRTLPAFAPAGEALVVAVYHSASTNSGSQTTGNPGTFGGSITGLVSAPGAVMLSLPAAGAPTAQGPGALGRDMEIIKGAAAECMARYGRPSSQAIDRARPMGYGLNTARDWQVGLGAARAARRFNLLGQRAHCNVWVDASDSFAQGAQNLADHFETVVLPQVQAHISSYDSTTSPWHAGVINVLISSSTGDFAYFHPLDMYAAAGSNREEVIYLHPGIRSVGSPRTITLTGGAALAIEDYQSILAHEFQHFMRYCRKIYQSGGTTADSNRDGALDEGLSQYMEILTGNGFTNSATGVMSGMRTYDLLPYLGEPDRTPLAGINAGMNSYSAGLMMVLYLVDHYPGAFARMQGADGKMGLDCVTVASGESHGLVVDKQALAMALSSVPGMADVYRYTATDLNGKPCVDLSGGTRYDGAALHTAYSYLPGPASPTGLDMARATAVSLSGGTFLEYAPLYLKLYGGQGRDVTITIDNLAVNGSGRGEVHFYVLTR